MGWTFTHREKGRSNADWFFDECFRDSERYTLVETATVRGTFYAAVRDAKLDQTWCFVALTRWERNPRDGFNFGYKDMDETMGPCEASAPARVLDALTPTDSEYANEWRARCRETIAQRERAKSVKPGVIVRFIGKRFVEGLYTFVGKLHRYRDIWTDENGRYVRLPGWREVPFEVVVETFACTVDGCDARVAGPEYSDAMYAHYHAAHGAAAAAIEAELRQS